MKGLASFLFTLSIISLHLEAQLSAPGFLENGGQWDENVHAAAPMGGGECFLTRAGWTYKLYETDAFEAYHEWHHHKEEAQDPPRLRGHVLRVDLLGAALGEPIRLDEQSGRTNVLKRHRSARDLRTHNSYIFHEVYPNIDLLWEQENGHLKYTFIAGAQAEISDIRMHWIGQDGVELTKGGELSISTSVGALHEKRPYAYQLVEGKEVPCASRFVCSGDTVRLESERLFPDRPLYLDPDVIFSTYSGSVSDNWGFTATYDASGRMYLGGIGFGSDFPVSLGAFDTTFAGTIDITLMRLSADGVNREFATWLGGSEVEQPHSLIADGNELIIFGVTGSLDFPVSATAFDSTFNGGSSVPGIGGTFSLGSDLFVSRLSADGSQLIASTYLGGSDNDGINAALINNYGDAARGEVNLDANGNILIASCTNSADFPETVNQSVNGAQDATLTKLSGDLSQVMWSTRLGGLGNDAAFSTAAANGWTYVTGTTVSNTFPATTGSWSLTYFGGTSDGFLSAVNDSGQLVASTYIGSFARDFCFFLYPDPSGRIAVLGQTNGNMAYDQPVVFGDSTSRQFLQLFSPDLKKLLRSTRIGSLRNSYDFSPSAFLIDSCGVTYMSGWGGSLNPGNGSVANLYVSPDAYQSTTDGEDFYLLALDASWKKPLYATYFGGDGPREHVDGGTSRFSPDGIISQAVCAGCGGFDLTPAFPSTVWSTTNNSSNCNMLGFKIEFQLDTLAVDLRSISDTACTFDSLYFLVDAVNADSLFWSFGDGRTYSGSEAYTSYTSPGDYWVRLTGFNSSCQQMASDSVLIHILDSGADTELLAQFDECDSNRTVLFDLQGSPDYYLLYTGTGVVLDSLPASVSYPDSGAYAPYLVFYSDGCLADQYDTLSIYFAPLLPPFQVELTHKACTLPLELIIDIETDSSSTLQLDYGDGTIDSGNGNRWVHTYAASGTYSLRIQQEDSLCKTVRTFETQVQIGQEDQAEVSFPNVFTPNGDGVNDRLTFDEALNGWDVIGPELLVYNRWGKEVYAGPASWDGLCRSEKCKESVYFWTLRWTNSCGEAKSEQGFVHLMR